MFKSCRLFLASVPLTASLLLSGCIVPSFYIDAKPGEVTPDSIQKPATPQPVQLLFEFQTNGAANTKATDVLSPKVLDVVQKSGLFSQVGTTPAPGGALLNIVINDVQPDNIASKGFTTGFTFGAVGSVLPDQYVCTASYVPAPGTPAIVKEEHHTIYTEMGAVSAPADSIKVEHADEAVFIMTRQIVAHALRDLSLDPGFTH